MQQIEHVAVYIARQMLIELNCIKDFVRSFQVEKFILDTKLGQLLLQSIGLKDCTIVYGILVCYSDCFSSRHKALLFRR